MNRWISVLFSALLIALGTAALAQERVWIQIEARPSLAQGEAGIESYYGSVSPLNGFRLRSGWYAIALGPFDADSAAGELRRLRALREIPSDSFISDGSDFREQFWPTGVPSLTEVPAPGSLVTSTAPTPDTPTQLIVAPEETRAEARASERLLTRPERELIQTALQWEGFYRARIDGDFGPGTRRSMEDYQAARNYEVTGVLTTKQRAELVEGYQSALASIGLELLRDEAAGIEIVMPLARVAFDRYEPPFVHYKGRQDDSAVRALLISQEGDRNSLTGLYDIMQTLEIVPLEGRREKNRDNFTLTGQDATRHSYTYAVHDDGIIKGFTLVWAPEEERLMRKVVDLMQASFRPIGDEALDETLGEPTGEQRVDLLAGLEIRKPEKSRSGFFVTSNGVVLTTAEAISTCTRVTIADEYEADVTLTDDTLGVAILKPKQPLAPMGVAGFSDTGLRLQSEIAVAGYSYGGLLGAPTMSFGTLSDVRGLAGEEELGRLAVLVEPGDTGGPVFDAGGTVVGMLLPKPNAGNRVLPGEVNFAANADAIAAVLDAGGVRVTRKTPNGTLAPEQLASMAGDMTVLVSCWN